MYIVNNIKILPFGTFFNPHKNDYRILRFYFVSYADNIDSEPG